MLAQHPDDLFLAESAAFHLSVSSQSTDSTSILLGARGAGQVRSKTPQTATVTLDTPQQDKDWSAEQKSQWVKESTQKMFEAINQPKK
jgi:hypothetical protein